MSLGAIPKAYWVHGRGAVWDPCCRSLPDSRVQSQRKTPWWPLKGPNESSWLDQSNARLKAPQQDTPHLWLTSHLGGNCFLFLFFFFQNRNIKCSTSRNSARLFSLDKYPLKNTICSCCCCSVGKGCPTLCDAMDYSMPDSSVLDYLLEFAQIHVYWVGDAIYLIVWRPLLLWPSIFPRIRVFSNELTLCIRCSKYCSFSINPSNEYSGLISFRIDWFDLLTVQGTLKSLLQHHSLKTSILQCSAFFMVQMSHPYVTLIHTHIYSMCIACNSMCIVCVYVLYMYVCCCYC